MDTTINYLIYALFLNTDVRENHLEDTFQNKERTQRFYDLEIENFNRENILVGLLSAICRTQICFFIGVKPKKNDNFKSGKCLQTIDFTGFEKKYKNY